MYTQPDTVEYCYWWKYAIQFSTTLFIPVRARKCHSWLHNNMITHLLYEWYFSTSGTVMVSGSNIFIYFIDWVTTAIIQEILSSCSTYHRFTHTPDSRTHASVHINTHKHVVECRVWVIEGETERDCKASCAAGSPAKWRAEPASWRLMIRWRMNWAQMASTSSLPSPTIPQQFYIFSLSPLVILEHTFTCFSAWSSCFTFSYILSLAAAGSKPSAPLSLEVDQFSFAAKAFVSRKKSCKSLLSVDWPPYVQFMLVN